MLIPGPPRSGRNPQTFGLDGSSGVVASASFTCSRLRQALPEGLSERCGIACGGGDQVDPPEVSPGRMEASRRKKR